MGLNDILSLYPVLISLDFVFSGIPILSEDVGSFYARTKPSKAQEPNENGG